MYIVGIKKELCSVLCINNVVICVNKNNCCFILHIQLNICVNYIVINQSYMRINCMYTYLDFITDKQG